MFLRKITQEVPYPRSPDEAFDDIHQTLLRIGKVKSADVTKGTLYASVSGGGWVTLAVTIVPAENGSLLSLVARCDDIFAGGARRGLAGFLQALPNHQADLTAPVQVRSVVKPPNLEDNLSLGQKISVALFLVVASMGSLDVAWKRGLFPLSLEWLYAIVAAGGAFTGWMLVKRRYWLPGLLGGAVAGLGAVGFSVFLFAHMTTVYNLVAVATTLLGCLPGVVLVLGLRSLQDRLFPPPGAQKNSGQSDAPGSPEDSGR